MANFQAGTWSALPGNCTRNYVLSFSRCAQYGLLAIGYCFSWLAQAEQTCLQWGWSSTQSCLNWATQTTQACLNWCTTTSNSCCTWWPCSWGCAIVTAIVSVFCTVFGVIVTTTCVLWGVVVTAVCIVFGFIVSVVCAVFTIISWIVCLIWSVVLIIGCFSHANGGTAFLLTDGSVLMQECQNFFGAAWATRRWWKLIPDSLGNYENGRWHRVADSTLGRRYFASAILADGRVVVCGGEYSDNSGVPQQDDINSCEIYDPVIDSWTMIDSPPDATNPVRAVIWGQIGDSPCTLTPDGSLLMGSALTPAVAKLDPATLTWRSLTARTKRSAEQSWVLMPDNQVVSPSCDDPLVTWQYDIPTDTWTRGNDLTITIGLAAAGDAPEVGPAVLLYDGTAIFIGGNQHTAIYNPNGRTQWANGPDLPMTDGHTLGVMDGPAALLSNGNLLFGAGPVDTADYNPPTLFFEFDGTTFNRTADPPNNDTPTYMTRLLLLPTGDVMFAREDSSGFYLYHSDAAVPQDTFRPIVRDCPQTLVAGQTIQISGFQFNGLSQATAYGDDSQTATNYPLVRIVQNDSNLVTYCRTFNHSTVDDNGNVLPSMGVATGLTRLITTNVEIPSDIATGASSLFVVANGIASAPFDVSVSPIT
jgi:hypothetical protein